MGNGAFMEEIDAIVMGRTTFETAYGFDMEWPYQKPVFVLSNSLACVPEQYQAHVTLVKGSLTEILRQIHEQGHNRLYVDGGLTIQGFLKEDLIDEMTITTTPTLLGGGSPLFADLSQPLDFACTSTAIFLDKVVQNCFKKVR
jgi:dihydrofolate reductase